MSEKGWMETEADFLERMKEKAYTKMIYLAVQVDMPDLKRLIEQAERAQELEEVVYASEETYRQEREYNEKLQKENARLRAALDWIEEEAKADEYGAQERVLKAIAEKRQATGY